MSGRSKSSDLWGLVDRVEGFFEVGTAMLNIGPLPLIPCASFIWLDDGTRVRIPLSLKSCALSYAVAGLGLLSFVFAFLGFIGLVIPPRLPGLTLTLVGIVLFFLAREGDRLVPWVTNASYRRAKALLHFLDAAPHVHCALALRFGQPLGPECEAYSREEIEQLRAFDLASTAAASRPTLVRASTLRYYLATRKLPWGILVMSGLCLLGAVVGGIALHRACWLLLWPAALVPYFFWPESRIRDSLRAGDLRPGLVVSTHPCRVAVVTDLTTSMEDMAYPAIKVFECRPASLGRQVDIGDRVPCGSLYYGVRGGPRWETFKPMPVVWGTGDADTVRRCIERIPEEDWSYLKSALRDLPAGREAGLYTIDPAPSDPQPCGWRKDDRWRPGTRIASE